MSHEEQPVHSATPAWHDLKPMLDERVVRQGEPGPEHSLADHLHNRRLIATSLIQRAQALLAAIDESGDGPDALEFCPAALVNGEVVNSDLLDVRDSYASALESAMWLARDTDDEDAAPAVLSRPIPTDDDESTDEGWELVRS